jgi:hypothetical protein
MRGHGNQIGRVVLCVFQHASHNVTLLNDFRPTAPAFMGQGQRGRSVVSSSMQHVAGHLPSPDKMHKPAHGVNHRWWMRRVADRDHDLAHPHAAILCRDTARAARGHKERHDSRLTAKQVTTVSELLTELAEKEGWEDPWEETDYDEAMKIVRDHFMQDDHTTVRCEVTSHMVSGSWGLGQFISGDRGYFYRLAEWGVGDDEGEAIPILSAWEPASDPQVYYELLTPDRRNLCACYPDTILEIGTQPKVVMDLRKPVTPDGREDLKQLTESRTEFGVIIECSQIYTVPKADVIEHAYSLSAETMTKVDQALQFGIGIVNVEDLKKLRPA